MRDTKPPLSEARVAAYLQGELSDDERAEVEAAIDRDPQWLVVVALLARNDGTPRMPVDPPDEDGDAVLDRVEREHAARLRPGARLGRYEVESPLGRGGMGMVYTAHDPELDRSIALKLLRRTDPPGQARLLAEARALARLSDRHVITIYDVGTWNGRVFLAMELLGGPTLQAWRAAASRGWRQVLAAYVDAGRGLVAAHEAGLVHRDFKPSNVVLADDGRVVVLDFGLARLADAEAESLHDDEAPAPADESATRTGRVLGTPAYMAPEQRRGEICGASADQFSFCAALFESLHGKLPPESAQPEARAIHGAATGRVPRRVDRLIARGLLADPERRHASLRELVDALARAARPRRRWPAALVLGGAGAAALAVLAMNEREPACTGAAAALGITFDEPRIGAVTRALGATAMPWSARVSTEVETRLRAFATAWIVEHEATCRASEAGEQSQDELDLRMRCLDRRRRSLGAVMDVLATADAEAAARAVQAVDALPAVAGCRDVDALRAPVAIPASPEVEALFDQLARVEALREATRYADAATLANDAVARAVQLAHAPIEADARLAAGWVHADRGEHEAAETELRAALQSAQAGHHDEAVAIAFNRLAWVVGYKLARHDEGRELAEHASAWSRRLGGGTLHELGRLRTLGWIEHEAGVPAIALERFEAALAIAEQLPADQPASPQELALVLNGIGAAAHAAADQARAQDSFTRAEQLLEAQLGPDHPDVARVRNNLASILRSAGKPDQAATVFERNLVVFESTFGANHPLVGQTLINLAVAELDLGRHSDAERDADRAITVLTAAHDAGHPLVAKAHTIRADARIQLGRAELAIADLELALDIERRTLGVDHPSVGIIESNLGGAYYDLGRNEDAATHQQRAIAIIESSLGGDHPNVAFVQVGLGLTRRAQGRTDEALALFRLAAAHADPTLVPGALLRVGETLLLLDENDEALVILERARALQLEIATDPGLAGETCIALARARWGAGNKAGARTAAIEAIDALAKAGDTEAVAEARTWLASHGGADE